MRSSLMIGYCLRTSAAASRPSSTSCFGVYLFFGSLTSVCAKTLLADSHSAIAKAAVRMDEVLFATARTISMSNAIVADLSAPA